MSLKILVITPKMPFPKTGADEQDRGSGIEDLKRLGHEVRVVTKAAADKVASAAEESRKAGIKITAVPYIRGRGREHLTIAGLFKRVFSPWTWDGAAYEYYDPAIQEAVTHELDDFRPDLVWFDYTYLWPLYQIARARNIPIITRSINWEPAHFIGEDGWSPVNALKYLPKLASEILTIKKSDLILSITPREEATYRRRGANVRNLPLRGLPHILKQTRIIAEREPLHVFFFGSTYNVHHNRHALEFLLKEIIPKVRAQAPGRFQFHILGSKLPAELQSLCVEDVEYEGFVDDLDAFLERMDIAVIPSLIGAFGMQGKIFEPLARGIPMVASSRGLAGYPFKDSEHYLAAASAEEFAAAILRLQDAALRRKLSLNSLELSNRLFSREAIDKIIADSIHSVTRDDDHAPAKADSI